MRRLERHQPIHIQNDGPKFCSNRSDWVFYQSEEESVLGPSIARNTSPYKVFAQYDYKQEYCPILTCMSRFIRWFASWLDPTRPSHSLPPNRRLFPLFFILNPCSHSQIFFFLILTKSSFNLKIYKMFSPKVNSPLFFFCLVLLLEALADALFCAFPWFCSWSHA